jgi:hypothetical protein
MWYSALLLLQSELEGDVHDAALCEHRVILLQGGSETEAENLALEYGKAAEHSYANEQGATVSWRFVRLLDLQEVGEAELVSGVGVYSHLFFKQDCRTAPEFRSAAGDA